MVHLRLIKEWGIKSKWKRATNIFADRNFVLPMKWRNMHPRIKIFSFWELMKVLNFFDFDVLNVFSQDAHQVVNHMCSHQVPNVWTPQALNAFLACSQAPNLFPKMFAIAHHTLSHKFCQSWTITIIMPSRNHLYDYIWEVQTFIGGGVVQTSKFHITFEIVWYVSHNYLAKLTIGDSQVVVGYCFFTFYNAHNKAHVIYKVLTSLIGLVYRNNMNWDTLHSPNAKHCLIHLLGINFKKWNFALSFLTMTRHCTSNSFD